MMLSKLNLLATAVLSCTSLVSCLPSSSPRNSIYQSTTRAEEYEGYAFAYFTGNSIAGEKIYLAASKGNDALQWNELNGAQPILTSTQGTKGLRDPFLIRSHEGDKFFLLATDLSIGSGTSCKSFRDHYPYMWE